MSAILQSKTSVAKSPRPDGVATVLVVEDDARQRESLRQLLSADGVEIVSRDRTAAPAPGLYNVCYVNGFQAQPNEEDFWLEQHPTLVLRDEQGDPVIDEDWDEMLLDVGTPEKRTAIAAIVGSWITGCKVAGFDAIEWSVRDGGHVRPANVKVDLARLPLDDAKTYEMLQRGEVVGVNSAGYRGFQGLNFAIPSKYQYRALLWGIIGVIVLRGIMIAGGAALVSQAYWVLYIFAAFMIATGIKMFFAGDEPMDVANNPAVRFISRHMPLTFLQDRPVPSSSSDRMRRAMPRFMNFVP